MSIKVAINGYGRIGRAILRALYENKKFSDLKIVAINNIGALPAIAHLTKYDSTHGTFNKDVNIKENSLYVDGDKILTFSEREPRNLPWKDLDVDVVLECTGAFTSHTSAMEHIKSGAKKVLISAPASSEVDATIVYGVNHNTIKKEHQVISNASCTTNCLATLVKPLHEKIGIERGLMTTVHAYTNDQVLSDVYHSDLHRARSATQSIIPTKTGAASSIGLVIPTLKGKLDGFALRVPVLNVSVVDLSFEAARKTTIEEINNILIDASSGELKDTLTINKLPLVSIDFNHNPASCIFDITQTKVIDNFVKVIGWYDNEWGFANRMLDVARIMKSA